MAEEVSLEFFQDCLEALTARVSQLETTLAHMPARMEAMSVRMDEFDRRLARIERHLDLVDVGS